MPEGDALHELRNQLGIVLGFAELIVDEPADAASIRDGAVEIQKAAIRALELIEELRASRRSGEA